MIPIIYGIPNCDKIRKARKWLDGHIITHEFVDLRVKPPSRVQVSQWLEAVGASNLINRRSTTWREMSDTKREEAQHGDVIAVLCDNPTLIRRPVMEYEDNIMVGFLEGDYARCFCT